MTDNSPFKLSPDRRPPDGRHPDAPDTEPYIAADELITAVNLAIDLRRPLLLEGDAGCGKSRLASYVASELGLPLYKWPVRSSSQAKEGLYTYDSIMRLHDVHLRQYPSTPSAGRDETKPSAVRKRNPENPMDYVTFGALGKAFRLEACSAVVLIDEIDKADLDFPNDLLTVLEEQWFEILEAEEPRVEARHPPIVIITSNKEKGNLPAPFLRRCIYFFIEFPSDPERLKAIVDVHYQTEKTKVPGVELVDAACRRFLEVRGKGDLYKKPSTSEFLDWLKALHKLQDSAGVVKTLLDESVKLPYPELLFKLQADWKLHTKTP